MNIAINSDIFDDINSPEPYLKLISEAGFVNIMWCHHWNTDFIYGKAELEQIKQWLTAYQLQLQDVHGTDGREKCWYAVEEYRRRAGVELTVNRLLMLKELNGSGTLIMHPPRIAADAAPERVNMVRRQAESVRRSLDELIPLLEKYDAKIALENLPCGNWEILSALLDEYPAKVVGFCFDSGHCNITKRTHYGESQKYASRIIALHLHDNDGSGDQHQSPFTGSFNWEWLADILKNNSYDEPLNFELSCRKSPFYAPDAADHTAGIKAFLADARLRCEKFAAMCKK